MMSRTDALSAAGVGAGWNNAARLLLLLQILGFAFMVAGTHGAFGPQPVPPTTTDFASFYTAGFLANHNRPEAAYDQAAHRAAEFQTVAAGVEEKRFVNPPIFLLICAPLAKLPYHLAFVLFESATFAAWLALGTHIAGGGPSAAMLLAAIPSVWWVLGWGQNSFLSASLLAVGTLLVSRRPWVAGAAFGAICFKPHLAMLVPVALITGCHWRAVIAAVATVVTLSTMSVVCFGTATWKAFFSLALHARPSVGADRDLAAHTDIGSALRLLGAPLTAGWAVQIAAVFGSAVFVAWSWRRTRGSGSDDGDVCPLAKAGLIAGTLAAAPFLLFYDLAIASLAAAWIAQDAQRHGWAHRDVAVFTALTALDLVAYPAAACLHIDTGALVPLILMWLIIQRTRQRSGCTGSDPAVT